MSPQQVIQKLKREAVISSRERDLGDEQYHEEVDNYLSFN